MLRLTETRGSCEWPASVQAARKARITTSELCIRCGACLVQCPQDALSFATPDGRVVGPDTIRRYKLNLFGKRATEPERPTV